MKGRFFWYFFGAKQLQICDEMLSMGRAPHPGKSTFLVGFSWKKYKKNVTIDIRKPAPGV